MNDVVDAVSARIKSPYFGYAFLAFIGLNWRGIFLLVVSDADPVVRLETFDSETSVWSLIILPLIAGALVAASTHWIRYIFLRVAEKPLELIESVNLEAEHKKVIRHSELEQSRTELFASREKELIDRAKRDEAIEEIADDAKKKELEQEIGKIRRERDTGISTAAREIVMAASSDKSGIIMKPQTLGGRSIQAGNRSFGEKSQRDYAKYEEGLDELISLGYVKDRGQKGEVFELTHKGWGLADAT